MQYLNEKNTYFAAANGYTGFRSYFDELFLSECYEEIFVIKGGPGTGKSSLLKKLHGYAEECGLSTEAILCSSDPNSYDGLIVSRGERRIAFLDGTAPHERDAQVPGAIDKLINLGEYWNESVLRASREEILRLTRRKKRAYKKSYEFLALSSVFDSKIKAEFETEEDKAAVKNAVSTLLPTVENMPKGNTQKRLISSFSRHGKITLQGIFDPSQKIIHLVGEPVLTTRVVTRLCEYCLENGIEATLFPTVFESGVYEALYFRGERLLIHATDICTNESEVIPLTSSVSEKEDIKRLLDYKTELLAFSKKMFEEASEAHLALEKIYTGAMRFEGLDSPLSEAKHAIDALIV